MKTTFLYTLSAPETGKIRYLGKSDNPFKRLRKHLADKIPSHRVNWISGCKARGLVPHMDLLDEVPVSQWQFWEREYIRVFRAIGINLVNGTDGGDGCSNPSPESLERKRQLQLGKPKSPETKARMSAAQLGKKRSPEHCANISAAQLGEKNCNFGKKLPHAGVPRSPECRAKISAALTGVKHSTERNAAKSARQKGRKGASPSEATRQTMSKSAILRWEKKRGEI